MTSCLFLKRTAQVVLAAVPVGLVLLLLPGCDQDSYSEDLTYPLRTDPLVFKTPDDPAVQPVGWDLPGQYPQELLAGLRVHKATLIEVDKVGGDKRRDLDKLLNKLFGKPAHPKVDGIDADLRTTLQLQEPLLAEGSALYRHHCLHCHGMTGDGRGHTAPWINPHPRDFRRGTFKFTSSSQSEGKRKPRRDDLLRTLRQGVEGTAMPSFGLLPESDLQALASYVMHLSLRGQAEIHGLFEERDPDLSLEEDMTETLTQYAQWWQEADQKEIKVDSYASLAGPPLQESVDRGYHLFLDKGCYACHENFGRKDRYLYDVWGTIVRPRDLTQTVYRGGHRPIDLYWRIHSGINGANMPASYPSALKGGEVWDVVNFVQALPYPAMLPRDIRQRVYGPG